MLELADGTPLAMRLYRGEAAARGAALVAHFHGGAFTHGSLDAGAPMARALQAAGAWVASIAYPLAPASRFPHALESAFEAIEWLHRHRTRLAGPAARLHLAGEEAGGNLAAALALMARDRGGPPIAGQLLFCPMLDPVMGTCSVRDGHAGVVGGCRWADGWHRYLRSPLDADHPYAAPASASRLAGLPRALLVTAADDLMRDETRAYARRLRAAGIEAALVELEAPTGWPAALAAPGAALPGGPALAARLREFLCAA